MTWQVFQILKCYLMGILLGMPFCRQARRFYVFLIIRFLVLRVSVAFLFSSGHNVMNIHHQKRLQICSRGMLPKRNGWFPNTFKAWEKACPWWGHITFSILYMSVFDLPYKNCQDFKYMYMQNIIWMIWPNITTVSCIKYNNDSI